MTCGELWRPMPAYSAQAAEKSSISCRANDNQKCCLAPAIRI
jgi:hypothetical protein